MEKPVEVKIQPYLSCTNIHAEDPIFDLMLSDNHSCFQINEMTEQEVRRFISELEDCLETWLMAKR